ncbi:MAG TPA: metal-dependent transcriptional regulator [Planctomycetaceae bacterium]|nr:metal-dependent transcriptional regulator [Planctomycetaceae bacterium]
MESVKVEDYIKAIYRLCSESQTEAAATGEIAERLHVTPGSVTTMLQRLADSGLVAYQAHRGARLSEAGRRLALNVLRRHRLLELFLVKTLGLTWDEIHEEAENLEHAASDRLIDRIDKFLGFPDRDPHGDPIPNADGSFRTTPGSPLAACANNSVVVLEQVIDQSPDFLRYLSEGGLQIGSKCRVVENHPSAGIITVRAGDRQISMSCEMASKLLVRKV